MSELPKGWTGTTLGDVLDYVQRGKSPKYADESELPVINQKCVRWWGIQEEFLKFICSDQIDTYTEERFLRVGDVLWNSTGTGTIGRAALFQGLETAPRAVVDGHVTILRSSAAIDSRYLFSFISSPNVQSRIEDMQSGTTNQVELSKTEILKAEIPLPPLPEQRRIVRKLDALSSRTTTARTDLAVISKLVERYRESILQSAFTGKLTADIRPCGSEQIEVTITDPFRHTQVAPATWKQHVFSEVCKIVGGSQPAKSNFVYSPQDGYIRLVQIRDYKSDAKATYIPRDLARRFCSDKDIMIGRYGPPIFQILRGIEGAYNVALMKAEPTEAVDQEFLFLYLHHPILFRYVEIDSKRTAGQDGVNKAHLERWPILLPPLEEQREIVRRIQTAFTNIDRLAAEADKALKLTDRLDQRILAKAFAGELVPQDQNDEPASALLDRIREARANAPKKPRKKPTKAKAMKVAPQERVLTDSAGWPEQGLPFEDIAKRLTLPHDDLKDAVFALLEGDAPKLRQEFDTDAKIMKLVRVTS